MLSLLYAPFVGWLWLHDVTSEDKLPNQLTSVTGTLPAVR
jgi:hypothetical protein